ncbi:MAG: hypothetical protein WEA58_07220 [Balneolaceae bacterium]
MLKSTILALFSILLFFVTVDLADAQQRSVPQSQQFRLAEGMVRIAEPGQLADTLSLWGDVAAPGRYIVPRGTNVNQLISYARGPISIRSGETDLDWSEVRLNIRVSRYDAETDEEVITDFEFRYDQPAPRELREFALRSDDIISLQVRRRATFRDYISVVAPAVSLILNAILLYDRATSR